MRSSIVGLLLLVVLAFICCGGCNNTHRGDVTAITAFSFSSPAATGMINEPAKTISVMVPYGTNVTAMIATFQSTGGASVNVGATIQVSGTTPNDFTNSVQYSVTAVDGSVAIYTVTVTPSPSSEKAVTAFSFSTPSATGIIDESAKTICIAVPPGTNVTALVATYQSTGTTVKVNSTPQTSGTTANDFTTPLRYQITAADGSSVTYTVTVNFLESWKIVSSVSFGDYVSKVAFSEKKAYVAYGFDGVCIIDISDPINPFLIGSIDPYGTVSDAADNMYDIAITNNIACIAVVPGCTGWCSGFREIIRLYDVEDPAVPLYLSSVEVNSEDIYAEGELLYATGYDSATITNHLFIIDISDPKNPFIKSSVQIPSAGKLAKKGDFVYVSYNDLFHFKEIIVVDVADSAKPFVISPSDANTVLNIAHSPLALFDDFAYVADGDYGLDIVDISASDSPTIGKTITTLSPVTDVAVSRDGYLLVTHGSNTTGVYGLQTPQNPAFFAEITTRTGGKKVFVTEGVGVVISDEERQYNDYGYSIIESEKFNLFFTSSN